MDYVKKAIWGPDPKEQHRKIKAALRKNGRQIDRNLNELQMLQKKTKDLIKRSAKQNDMKAVRVYAKELYQINKQYNRMYTSKATLNSVTMKVEEAYKMKNLTNSMATSTGIMREVNSLVRLPQIQTSMVELEKELMKAGIMTEMVDDTMESLDMGEDEMDEEVNEQVNKIIEEYTTDKFAKVNNVPDVQLPTTAQSEEETPEDKVDEEADKMIDDMRQRLRALQS
ncbi:vacuolar protein-sorting-associated protein 24 [Monosporozyma unispora]|nr:Vacuolar protein-sorting-associated protein 24 [Kazachstania unispora]